MWLARCEHLRPPRFHNQVSSHHRLPTKAKWAALFGVVPDRGLHRRPSDVLRVIIGTVVVGVGAAASYRYSSLEKNIHELVTNAPNELLRLFRMVNGGGLIASAIVVFAIALSSRRLRFIASLIAATASALCLSALLQYLVNAPNVINAAAKGLSNYPQYPSIRISCIAAIFFVSAPELTRPSRRLMMILLTVVAVSATALVEGYPAGIIGSLFLGWMIAAAVHLAFGSPDGMPDPREIESDLDPLGYEVRNLQTSALQTWGEKAFTGRMDEGNVRVVVIGRDATEGQLLSKVGRFLWYKDSGPTLTINHQQQIEHRAFLLLLAERAGVSVPKVLNTVTVGARNDAILLLRTSNGQLLGDVERSSITDALIDESWNQLALLHKAGISHGGIWTNAFRAESNSIEFTDLATANANPEVDEFLSDQVALLVTTAELTDRDRAIEAAERSLGNEGLAALLPFLQMTALPKANRKSIEGARKLCSELRTALVQKTGVEAPKLVELRRVAPISILVAVLTIFGVYLLVGQFAHVEWAAMFNNARWWWVPAVFIIAQIPILGSSMSLLGAVSKTLPLRPVVLLQIGTKFTGLAGGGVTTIALQVRFFQKQGLRAAIAVTASLLNSVASGTVQVSLLVVSLVVGTSSFNFAKGGTNGLSGKLLIAAAVVAIICAVAFFIPGLRRRLGGLLLPQIRSAGGNLKAVLREPKKGVQMIGGNLLSQVAYAFVLWAALHVYGESLGIVQLIVINTFASILGGIAPVPGGIGVIEAGLIGGFTAAGIPDEQAIAATFTARLFTAYLPPIWGWLAINWMRRRDYV